MKPATPAQPPAKTDNRRPLRAHLTRSVRADIAADAAWTPGPLYNVLPGFIPRPAKLPGIKRWQVISVAPRDTRSLSIDWSATGLIACVN